MNVKPFRWFQFTKKRRLRNFLAALRSGKYLQSHGELAGRDTEAEPWKYCCLGVACEVAVQDGLRLDVKERQFKKYYNNEGGVLPPKVADWYGFNSTDPHLWSESSEMHRASALNDRFKMGFEEIADAFEQTFLPNNPKENQ
jgi:hypothetical protein